jgi:hypothetical protein
MMNEAFTVILFYSSSHAIRAEKVLQRAGLVCKLMPVPRHLSSDCGVSVRIRPVDREAACQVMEEAHVEVAGLHALES